MFSGIVERMGEVVEIRTDRQNKDFTLRADFCKELKIDQSIAHNGVCLTVVDIRDDTYTVTAMKETLDKSNLGLLKTGDLVNLERSMKPDALLDGHIVQGHVDQTAVCTAKGRRRRQLVLHFRIPTAGRRSLHRGERLGDGERREPDGLRFEGIQLPRGDHSLYVRAYELLPHRSRLGRKPRI